MADLRSEQSYRLEALEPRLLLSADPAAAALHEAEAHGDAFPEQTAVERIEDAGLSLDLDLDSESEADSWGDFDFVGEAEDLPASIEEEAEAFEESRRQAIQLFSSGTSEKKSFEYSPDRGKALNATLKSVGADLVLTDNASGTELARQSLSGTSSVLLNGSALSDKLTIEKSSDDPWGFNITFNGFSQTADGMDEIHVRGNAGVNADYKPSKSTGSGVVEFQYTAESKTETIQFSGIEDVSIHELKQLTLNTPEQTDVLTIDSPTLTESRIVGKSGSSNLIPLTFSDIESFVLNAASHENSILKGHDQVTIKTAANRALTAGGLKNFTIQTGLGNDGLFINGTNLTLPVSGGVLSWSAGPDSDSLFADDANARGELLPSGTGTFGSGSSLVYLTDVERLQDLPDRPLLLVPDFFGSFPNNSNVALWSTKTGLHPDQLELEKFNEVYRDIVASLKKNGYQEGVSLFVALWDWRLPLSVQDGVFDGVITGLTGSSISDEVFQHGTDYFGYALKQSMEGWASANGGERPESVDTIAMGAGGIVVRTYLQSTAYNTEASGGGLLPKIENLAMIATPHRGQTESFMMLNDDWSATKDVRLIGVTVNLMYERLIAGGFINTPLGAVQLDQITDNGANSGTPVPEKFLALIFPGLRDLVPTYAFIDDGSGALKSLNGDPLRRNNLLLDLNDGMDVLYTPEFYEANRNPNRFVDKVEGKVTVIYSDSGSSPVNVTQNTGGEGTVWTFTQLLGKDPLPDETWYLAVPQDASGDRVVPTISALNQFLEDSRFGSKIVPVRIDEFSSGTGAFHYQLFFNHAVFRAALNGMERSFQESDFASDADTNIFQYAFRAIKFGVLFFVQETQLGSETFNGSAAISVFQGLMQRIGELLDEYLLTDEENPDESSNIIDMGTDTFGFIPLPIPGLIRIDGTSIEFRDFTYNKLTKKFSGKVGFGADALVLFPGSNVFRVTGSYITGLLEFSNSVFLGFELTIGELRGQFKDLISVGGRNITINPFGDIVFSAGELFGGIPRFKLEGKVLGMQVTRDGDFFISGFAVEVKEGLLNTLNLGKYVPLDIVGVQVKFLGDINENGFIDSDETFKLTEFDLTVTGRVSAPFWAAFPFTPVIQIGPQTAEIPGDDLTFTVTFSDGEITPKDIGPITFGFKDLTIGKVTLGATITLGGYQNGVFNPDFGGFLKVESGLSDLKGTIQASVTGDFSPDLGRLDISGMLNVGFSLKNGLIAVEEATLDFGMIIERIVNADGSFSFNVAPLPGRNFFLNKLQVNLLQVKFGSFLIFQSRNTILDFNAVGSDPLVQFGGTADTQNPENVFDPNSVPDGSLGAVFGPGAGPVQGWGGAVGNFAIGADLNFQILDGFFVQLKVGPNAKFGLPEFIPVELRAVTLQFNADAIENGKIVDPTNFSIIFSGGVKETSTWPLFGQFSGLKVNVNKLIESDFVGAIENLSGFSIGIKNVTLGPVTLGGALGLGIVKVNVPNGSGGTEEKSAFYARLAGTFFYSGIGGGIDIVFSQYGPILATMGVSGLVEPTTGFVFGFKDAGFTFGGSPLPSLEDPKELLSNPVFHSPTTITLAEIEKRIETAVIRAQPTWNESFTLSGTATVTNLYVQGMISGDVTMAANVGFQGEDAGLKFLINGQFKVLGLPMGSGAMLLDLANPLAPQLDMAFSLPAPNNPIGFLFPAKATLLASLDTTGVIEMPLIGLGVFIRQVSNHALEQGQELFDDVLIELAGELEENHDQPLSRILLDLNYDNEISEDEDSIVIDVEFLVQRLIGTSTDEVPGLLFTSFDALLALSPEDLVIRVQRGSLLINHLLPTLIFKASHIAEQNLPTIMASFIPVIEKAAIAGLKAGWDNLNPSLTLTGLIQPVLFGIPIGAPSASVSVIMNKDAISFGFEGTLASLLPIGGGLAPITNLFVGDKTIFGVTLDLPDELITGFITNLMDDGVGEIVDLPRFLLENINPYKGWEILFSSTLTLFGFKMGTFSGIVFGPQPMNNEGIREPVSLFKKHVVNLDPDGNSIPNQDLLDEIANGPPNQIPVNTKQQYEEMMELGGIVMTSQLFVPEILRDPVSVIQDIHWIPPHINIDFSKVLKELNKLQEELGKVQQYVSGIFDGLTQETEFVRMQVYLPSPAVFFNVGDYLDPDSQGEIVPVDLSTLDSILQEKLDRLLEAFYIEGYRDIKLMGIEFGNALVEGTFDSLRFETEIPWLAGLEANFEMKYKEANAAAMLYDIATGPLASGPLLALGIDNPADTFSFLKHEQLADLTKINLPVAVFEGTFTSKKLGEWLSRTFKIPEAAIGVVQDVANHEVFFAAYSPGFGEPNDSLIKRQGGFVLDAGLNIVGLVDNASFHFEIAPFSYPKSANPLTFLIPQFKATATVPSLTLPGLAPGSNLLSVRDFVFDLERNTTGLFLETHGTLSLLNDSVVFDAEGAFQILDNGMVGALNLTIEDSGNFDLSDSGLKFEGTTLLRINTTPIDYSEIDAHSSLIYLDGTAGLWIHDVQAFSFDGSFELAASASELEWTLDAQLLGEPLVNLSVAGQLNLSPDGIYGGLQLGPLTVDLPDVDFAGRFQLEVNTTNTIQKIMAFEVDRVTGQATELREIDVSPGTVDLVMGGSVTLLGWTLNGWFAFSADASGLQIESDASLSVVVGGATLFGFRTRGGMKLNDSGLAGALQLDLVDNSAADFGFTFSENADTGLMLKAIGGAMKAGNLAPQGTAFAQDIYQNGSLDAHKIRHLNDGIIGNSNSWLANGANSFAGVAFSQSHWIDTIAFGQDQTGQFQSRAAGHYTVEYTNVPNPSASTPENSWMTLGEFDYDDSSESSRRHEYAFDPVVSTGVRVVVEAAGLEIAIDELELYGPSRSDIGLLLELNTTGEALSLGGIALEGRDYVKLSLAGSLSSSGASVDGAFHLELGENGLDIEVLGTTKLTVQDETMFEFGVDGGLKVNQDGLAGAIQLDLNAQGLNVLGVELLEANSTFVLEVNSSNVPQTVGQIQLEAGPYFRIVFEGSMGIMGLNLGGRFDFTTGFIETPSAPQTLLADTGGGLVHFRNLEPGAILYFDVIGNSSAGGIWGSDIYTDDSPLATAVVHAGILQNGERGIVKVTLVEGQPAYSSNARNGVNSQSYGAWAGSYSVERATVENRSLQPYLAVEAAAQLELKVLNETLFAFNAFGGFSITASGVAGSLDLSRKTGSGSDLGFILELGQHLGDGLHPVEFNVGDSLREGNLALDGLAFAKDLINNDGYGVHRIEEINDGIHGNANSWIGNSANSFAGVAFGGIRAVASVAFGRDNTGVFADRYAGHYRIEYTTVFNPNEQTPDSQWIPIGEVTHINSPQNALRHEYQFDPVAATAIRVVTVENGLAIDEIEIYGPAPGQSGIQLELNTTGQEVTVGGKVLPAGPYARVAGTGSLSVGGLSIDGAFHLQVGQTGLDLAVDGTLELMVLDQALFKFGVEGGLKISNSGLIAALHLDRQQSFLDKFGAALEGLNQAFRLEINTTSQAQVIGEITLPKGPYALVSYEGGLSLSGLTLNGSFDFLVNSNGLAVNTESTLSLSVGALQLLGFSLNGGFAITNAGLYGAIGLNLVYNNPTPFGFSNPNPLGFTLRINTTGEMQSTGSVTLPEGHYAEVMLTTGSIGITDYNLLYGITLAGDFRFRVSDQGVTLSASGTTELTVGNQPLLRFNVQGDLEISSEGLAGVLSLERTFNQLDNYGLTLASGSSQFRLEINRGNKPRSIGATYLPAGPYTRVVMDGGFAVSGMTLLGHFEFTQENGRVQIDSNSSMDLKVLDQSLFSLDAFGGFSITPSGVAGSLDLSMKADFSSDLGFSLELGEQLGDGLHSVEFKAGDGLREGNLALDGLAFAMDLINNDGYGVHRIEEINDGIHGNSNSWIGNSSNSFVGVAFGGYRAVSSVAFGRDNTGVFADRFAGNYRIEYTTVSNPNEQTPDSQWIPIGEVTHINSPQNALRHEYRFDPVAATAIRVVTVENGLAIDEIEIYGPAPGHSGIQLELNTTDQEMTVGGKVLQAGPYARVAGMGSLSVSGLSVDGAFYIEASGQTLAIGVDGTLSLIAFDQPVLDFNVQGGLIVDQNGIAGAIGLELDQQRLALYDITLLEAGTEFRLEINLSSQPRTINQLSLSPGPYARVVVDGAMTVLGLTLEGRFDLTAQFSSLSLTAKPDPGAGIINYSHLGEGTELFFKVTGNSTAGAIWGTDIYTADSQLSKAVVHAGLLAHGETGYVKVTLVGGKPSYATTQRNGVTSLSFGAYSYSYTIAPAATDHVLADIGYGAVRHRGLDAGTNLYFAITGNVAGGGVWGTDVYTIDSSLATAAVHAGALAHGETGIVKVTLVEGLTQYASSSRNGVTSQSYTSYDKSFSIQRVSSIAVLPDPGSGIIANRRLGAGTVFYYQVTGNAAAGNIWGTDVYSDDSPLAAAVVHAGVLKQGETGIVKVTLADSQSFFESQVRNGIESKSFGPYGGSYFVESASIPNTVSQPTLSIQVSANLSLKIINTTFFQFSVYGAALLTPSGVAGALDLSLTSNNAQQFNLKFTTLNLVQIGNTYRPDNLAINGTPFAKDLINNDGHGVHQIDYINDGLYGNSRSWIGNSANSFAGVTLGGLKTIDRIAFGRDNTETFKDRFAGNYIVQYTTVAQPGASTADADWKTIDTVTLHSSDAKGHLRHEYKFNPIDATAIRIVTVSSGTGIDEIEVYEAIGTKASLRLELNTTSTAQHLGKFAIPAGPHAQIFMEGSFAFLGYSFTGQFKFGLAPDGLRMSTFASVDILGSTFGFSGEIGLYSDGIALSARIVGSSVSNSFYSVRGDFQLLVNTTPREGILGLPKQSVRLAVTNAQVNFAGSTLSGSLFVDIAGNTLNIEVPSNDPLTLRVLDNFEVRLHGHLRPNDINLNGAVAVSFGDKASIHFGGALEVKVSNSGISASATLGLTIWNVYVSQTTVNIGINAKRLTFDVDTAFQIHTFARYVGVLNVTIESGFVSVTANSEVRLWNTFNVEVKGSINSNGQYSFVGTTWLSIGNSNFGGDFTFELKLSSAPTTIYRFGIPIGTTNNTISMFVSGTARAGSTVAGNFIGATATFLNRVDHEGRFTAYVEASLEIPILKGVYFWAYPPWEWFDLHHHETISAGITVNFQLANGIRIWASELGDSEIYFTSNLDGTPDEFGSGGRADANGNANFNGDWEDLDVDELEALFFQVLDKNGDGRLDTDAGQIKVIGGYHWLTGEENPGIEVLTDRWLYSDSDWAEATVFIDRNQNDEIDEGELSVVADDLGFYDFWELIFGEEDDGGFGLGFLNPYDLNGDGVIDETEGVLVLTGGVDYFTGELNTEIEVFDFVEVFYETDWVGATVFLDTNGNLELDDFEVFVETDDFGFWDFSIFDDDDGGFEEDPYWELLDLIVYDLNEDGVITPDEGQIVVRGGFDLFTGEAFDGAFILDETLGYGFLDYGESEVFFDIDLDGEYDEGEPLVYSDDTGYFEFYTLSAEELLEDLVAYDLNGDGVITSDEGVLYLVGGKHWLTEEPNEETIRLDEALGFGETDFAGARVFLDLNGNATFDFDEPVALTDDYGFYWFYTPTLEEAELWLGALVKYDTNRDGFLSEEEGRLLLIGGTSLIDGSSNNQSVVLDNPYGFDFTDYANATVFFDVNGNGIHDEEELQTATDSAGYYEFISYSEEELQFHLGQLVPFDANGNAELDSEEGQFVVVGGTHIVTGVVNEGSVVDENIGLSGYTSYAGAAAIYFDANKNLELDDNEISVVPDQNNFYTFFEFDSDQYNVDNLGNLARYDTNHNGTLDPDEGIFVINGGTDQHTGLENTLFIRALGSDFGNGLASSVSPLSNLKVSMVNWWGIQPAEADRIIAAGFGLPDFLNMNMVNPLATEISDPVSQRVLSVGAILSSMTLDMAAALQAANPSLTALEAQVAVADSIADAIIFKLLDKLEEVNGLENLSLDDDGYFYGLVEGLDLSAEDYIYNSKFQVIGMPALLNVIDPSEFIAILEDAAYWTETDLTHEQVETTATVVVEKNKRIQALAQNDIGKPLETLASFKALSQEVTSEVLADYILNGGDPAAILAQYSGTALLNQLAAFAPENLAPYLQAMDDQYSAPGKTIQVPFNTWDLNQSVGDLEFSFHSSNESVVSNSSISVMGEGENKVLEFRVGNALTGHTELTVKVSDGELTTERTLRVEILPHVVKWESIAEHGNGLGEVGLEIEESGVFSEPRLGGIQILDVTFNESVDPNTVTGDHLYFVGISQESQHLMDLAHIDMEVTMLDGNSKARIVFSEPIPDHARFRIGFHGVETSQGFKLDIGTNRLITNLPGDANGDLKVNNLDLGGVRSLVDHNPIDVSSVHEVRSDFNVDGRVDVADTEQLYRWRGQNTQFIPSPSAPEINPALFNAATTGALALSSYLNAAFDTAAGSFATSTLAGLDTLGWQTQPASAFYWQNQPEPSFGLTSTEELIFNPWNASTLPKL